MILIDTNLICELIQSASDTAVLDWFGRQALDLYLNAVTEAELRRGVAILPAGHRRDALQGDVDAVVSQDFADRVLPFDGQAAVAFAAIFAKRRAVGRPIGFPDCRIAATARAASLATRNVEDFEGCGVRVANPWSGIADR